MRIQAAQSWKVTTPTVRPAVPEAEEPAQGEPESIDGLVFSLNDKTVAVIKEDGPSTAERFLTSTGRVLSTTARGLVSITNADPSFAFSEAAQAVKPVVLQNMPSGVSDELDKFFMPMLKGVSFVMNVKKWIDRRKKTEIAKINGTYGTMDKLGMVVDGAHLATDAVGMVGALGSIVVPGSPFFKGMLGASFMADVGVYSFHALEYIGEQGKQQPPDQPPPQQPPSQGA